MGTGFSYRYYSNPYLYSGKEIDRMNGLNEYDYGARWMDNAVPGFTTPDPLAELHYSESPYSYCGANPVNRVDPTGLAYFAGDGGAIWREGDNNDTWTDPRTHQKYSNIGDYYTFRTSGGTQTDYKGKFDSFVDDPAPDSKNYSFFNYGSMNGAKDNTGIANNSTTGWKNDQNGDKKNDRKTVPTISGKSDPNSCYGADGSYNLYSENENKAATNFIINAVLSLVGAGEATELGELVTTLAPKVLQSLWLIPGIAGFAEGTVKSIYGPDPETSSSIFNNPISDFGMNSALITWTSLTIADKNPLPNP